MHERKSALEKNRQGREVSLRFSPLFDLQVAIYEIVVTSVRTYTSGSRTFIVDKRVFSVRM